MKNIKLIKYIFFLSVFILSYICSFSQVQIPRSSPSVTVVDARQKVLLNFYLPRGNTLTINSGLDSSGMIFFYKPDSSIYTRIGQDVGANSWMRLLSIKDTNTILASQAWVINHGTGAVEVVTAGSVENVTDLRNVSGGAGSPFSRINGETNTLITLLGWYTKNDGGGGTMYWDDTSTMADNGVTIFDPIAGGAGRWKRVFNGVLKAAQAGVRYNGSDQTNNIIAALALSDVTELVFDNIQSLSVTISDTVSVPSGKILRFENDNQIIGTGTIIGGAIEANPQKQIFATTLNVITIENTEVYFKWFGAKDDNGVTDNSPILAKTIAATGFGRTIAMPTPIWDASKFYYFLTTVVVSQDRDIKIVGTGAWPNPNTYLRWPANTLCLDLTKQGVNGRTIYLENLDISQSASTGSIAAHGILSNQFVKFKNLRIHNISGDGIRIDACGTYVLTSNANGSTIEDCWIEYCNYGLYITGCDANLITVTNPSFVNNKYWGSYDNGFLGNKYEIPHYDVNGRDSNVLVSYGGLYYQAISPPSDNLGKRPDLWVGNYWTVGAYSVGSTVWDATKMYYATDRVSYGGLFYLAYNLEIRNINKQPDTQPLYWRTTTITANALAWNAAKEYSSGGTFFIRDINSRSQINTPYTEDGQPQGIVNARSIIVNGQLGTTLPTGGVHLLALDNKLLLNFGLYVGGDELVGGGNIYSKSLTVEGVNAPVIFNSTNSNTNKISFRNNNVNVGYLGAGGGFAFSAASSSGTPRLEITDAGLATFSGYAAAGSHFATFNPSGALVRSTVDPSGYNIYNTDGGLEEDRTVDGNHKYLYIDSLFSFTAKARGSVVGQGMGELILGYDVSKIKGYSRTLDTVASINVQGSNGTSYLQTYTASTEITNEVKTSPTSVILRNYDPGLFDMVQTITGGNMTITSLGSPIFFVGGDDYNSVGINTISPRALLDVSGGNIVGGRWGQFTNSLDLSSSEFFPEVKFAFQDENYFSIASAGDSSDTNIKSFSKKGNVYFTFDHSPESTSWVDVIFQQNDNEVMRFDSSGHILLANSGQVAGSPYSVDNFGTSRFQVAPLIVSDTFYTPDPVTKQLSLTKLAFNLDTSRTSTSATIGNPYGNDALLLVATHALAGLLSAEDKRRIDSVKTINNTGNLDEILISPDPLTLYAKSIRVTGSGVTPTITDSTILYTIAGSSGTVESFSAGDLSPLFTTSEATVTTTPALTFSLNTQVANTVFSGPASGANAAPTFRALVALDIPATLNATTIADANAPFFVNSTNSNGLKIGMQSAGVTNGYFGADATLSFIAADNVGNIRFSMYPNGNLLLNSANSTNLINFVNTSGGGGFMRYAGTDMDFWTVSTLQMMINSTGLTVTTISNGTGNFVTESSGLLKKRTAAQVLTDIGAASSAIVPVVLFADVIDVDNSGTTETDLYTYTTAANRLNATGESIEVLYSGLFLDVTATAQLKVYYDGTVIYNSTALTVTATGAWAITVQIIRTGSTTARSIVTFASPTASSAPYAIETDLTGLDFSSGDVIKISAESDGASGGSGDIRVKLSKAVWWPAPVGS